MKVCHRANVQCTQNFLVCRDENRLASILKLEYFTNEYFYVSGLNRPFSETATNIYCRHTQRLIGVLEKPFDGEWGWDYETDVMREQATVHLTYSVCTK